VLSRQTLLTYGCRRRRRFYGIAGYCRVESGGAVGCGVACWLLVMLLLCWVFRFCMCLGTSSLCKIERPIEGGRTAEKKRTFHAKGPTGRPGAAAVPQNLWAFHFALFSDFAFRFQQIMKLLIMNLILY